MFPPKTFAAARSRAISRCVEGFAAFCCDEDPCDAGGVADATAAAGRLLDAGFKTSVRWFWICAAHSSSLRMPVALSSWSCFVLVQTPVPPLRFARGAPSVDPPGIPKEFSVCGTRSRRIDHPLRHAKASWWRWQANRSPSTDVTPAR